MTQVKLDLESTLGPAKELELSQGRLRCREEVPPLRPADADGEHTSACHFSEELIGHRSKFSAQVPA